MKKYLLIRPSEDGEPCQFLDENKLDELLNNPKDFGVNKFLDHIPDKDPMYWSGKDGLLLEVKIVVPKVIATAFSL